MPRKPSRCSINQFDFSLNVLPHPEKHEERARYFGEKVFPEGEFYGGRRLSSNTSSEDHDRIPSGILDFGATSSSSSQDWTEEFDTAATIRVQEEFERMEKVLCGYEAVPKHYEADEYQQWMTTFPKSRLVHRAVSPEPLTTRKTHKTPPSRCGDRGCDCKEATSLPEHAKRNAVIEEGPNFTTKVFGDKLLGSASEHRTVFRRKKRPSITVTKPSESIADSLENQFESMLRVSPISLYGSSARLYLDGRRKSPQSVARSELQSSKWMQEDLSEYTFLPYLPNTSAKHRASRLVKQKHVETLSKPSANKNYRISLPPIKNLTFSSNYFRSISATPRHENKPSPTVSAQIGGIHKRKSQQLKPTNSSLASNEARRNSSVKYINQL